MSGNTNISGQVTVRAELHLRMAPPARAVTQPWLRCREQVPVSFGGMKGRAAP